ncbi:MAG: PrsW family intramembrane metalloprotease [Kofleriaceae bacterium]
MWVVDRLDLRRPEPVRLRRWVAIGGMVSVIPAIVVELSLMATVGAQLGSELTYQGASFHAFVVAAGVEEACKIAVVYWVVWRRRELDERMDGIVYASRAGLGFALVENVMYLLGQQTLSGQLYVWVARALLAIPGHAMWTGIIGGFAARRRFDGQGLGFVGGYLLAVAMHGAYDCSVFLQQPLTLEGNDQLAKGLLLVPVAITVMGFFVMRSLARTALRLDDADAARAAAHAAATSAVAARAADLGARPVA